MPRADSGLHSVWVSQHDLATPFQMLQQLPVLGRLAAEGEATQVGTNVFLLPIHNPVYVAEQVATLDVISAVAASSSAAAASATDPRSSTPSTWR